jgi:hypothetical protein
MNLGKRIVSAQNIAGEWMQIHFSVTGFNVTDSVLQIPRIHPSSYLGNNVSVSGKANKSKIVLSGYKNNPMRENPIK